MDTTNVQNEYFVFSALAIITGGASASNATQKIQARLVEGNVILAVLDFDSAQRDKQVQATTVCLNRGVHNLAVKLLISGTTASITLKDVRLTVASGGAQTEVSNLNTRMQNFSEHSSVGAKVWYKAAPVNLIAEHSKIELLSEVKFTVKDFNLTKLSYLKNPQNFNVWYNDGADLLYGVSALSVAPHVGSGGASSISVIRYGTVTESIGTKTFTYMQPTDTAGEYKVVTAIDDGTTAKVTEQMFNSYCLPTSTTDYNGVTQSTTYDQYGNVVTEKTSATPSATMNITKDYGYSAGGKLLTSEKTYRGTSPSLVGHSYDKNNYPYIDTDRNGKRTTYVLNDSKEKLLSMTESHGNVSIQHTFAYDGDLITKIAHDNMAYNFAYDSRNNISSVTIADDLFAQNKATTYNENGSCVSKTTYGNGQIVRKYYDKHDRLVKVTNTVGSRENVILAYLYSDEEVATNVTDPFDTSLKVSESSQLRVVISDGVRTTYTYDNSGQLVKTTNSSVTVENTETDDFNRVKQHKVSVDGAALATTTYTYENNVDQTLKREITQSGGGSMFNTSYERDTLQRPSKTKVVYGNNGYEVDYNYMPRQQKTNNVTTTTGTTTFVNKVSTYKLSGSTRTLESEEDIEYDSLGNITKYGNVTYKYDLCGRLVRENNPNLDRTIVWEYNTNNNIYVRAEYGYTTRDTLTTNELREARMLSYRNKWTDQLTSFKGYDITYDKAGNPTSYLGMTLGWTRGRLLQTVTKDGITYEYGYDGNGIRKKREVAYDNGNFMKHLYYYADGHIVFETRRGYMGAEVNQQIRYFYNQQGAVGMSYGGTHYLYRKNFFGDVIAIYDRSTCVARYTYDAFGVCKVRDANGKVNTDENFIGNINPIRYRGYYYDVETGFYYLQTRYYDPSACRFINADSLEYLDPETAGGLNLYAYCNGNPVMYVDPEGTLFGFIFWGMLIGALVVGTIGAICEGTEAYNNGARGWDVVEAAAEGFFEGAKAGAAIGSTIATIIYAAPAIAAFLSTTFTFGGMALITGGTTVMVTVTGAELVAIGAVAIAGIGLVLSKLPMNGGPANGTLTNGTSTGYYDGNGNLIERTDFSGKSHYIKEEGKYCLPHTHHYRWDYIKDAWRIIKRWITK